MTIAKTAIGPGALLLILVGATGCDRFSRSLSWEDVDGAAAKHYAAGQVDKVVTDCTQALEIADKVGNGGRALAALDCIAEMSRKTGRPELALPHYAKVLGPYEKDLRHAYGRFRIRNNYAAALFAAGKKAEAISSLFETIDTWGGTTYSVGAPDAFTVRMLLVRNLAKAARSDPKGKVAEWLVTLEADSILEHFARSSPNGVHLAMNGADALTAIADLASIRDEPARAVVLREAAVARKVEEQSFPDPKSTLRRRCQEAGTGNFKFEACFADIP